jgi:CRISPR-associated protein Csx17
VTLESELIEPLLPWLDRLPYEPSDSKQRGKFKGLRGPVEEAIVKIAERPDDTERWQQLLLLLADVQTRIDRNQSLRKSCAAVPRLSWHWFDKAWGNQPPTEVRIARAIASIGTNTDMPILCNVFGVHIDKKGEPFFPTERPQSAVWHHGDVVQVLANVLKRRLVDVEPTEELPLTASYFCNAAEVEELLEGALDWEMIGRWIPPLSLIRWSRPEERDTDNRSLNEHAADGHYLLSALFRPFFFPSRIELAGKELFPERLKPKSLIARRLLNLIRQGELGEAIKLCESRYLAANFPIVAPSLVETQRHDAIAASLLVPINVRDIVSGLRRWLQPEKSEEV